MSENKIIKTLHMITQADFIVKTARQAFWYEDREYWAKDLLSSFEGITEQQITDILNGDATVTGWSICGKPECEQCKGLNQCTYVEQEDHVFKDEIKQRIKYLNENHYKIGEIHVSKNIVDDYLIQKELVRILKKYGDVSMGEEDLILEQKYNGIFYDAINEGISATEIPEAGTKKHRFAIALQKFLTELYEKRKDEYWNLANRDLKKKLVLYSGSDLRILHMIALEDEKQGQMIRSFIGADRKTDLNADGDQKWPCEIECNGDIIKLGKFKIEKRFLDDYANEVRFTRSMMMLANSEVMQKEALKHPIDKREAKHRIIYTLLDLPYHGEEDRNPQNIIDDVWSLTHLIDDYVVEKYPEVDISAMADKLDFIEKFKQKQKEKKK